MNFSHRIIAVIATVAGTLSAGAEITVAEPDYPVQVPVQPVVHTNDNPDNTPVTTADTPVVTSDTPQQSVDTPEQPAQVVFAEEPYEVPAEPDAAVNPADSTVTTAADTLMAATRRVPRSTGHTGQLGTGQLTPGQALLNALDSVHIPVDPLPSTFFLPLVYKHFTYYQPVGIEQPQVQYFKPQPLPATPWFDWLDRMQLTDDIVNMIQHRYFYSNPQNVRYNLATLPKAPKVVHSTKVDPRTLRFEIREFNPNIANDAELMDVTIKKKHWLHTFNVSAQFSQAYVSPNWYQGGNNNLNGIGQIGWSTKLNQTYHPKLLFEASAQYKLGMNSAPNDTLHSYSITEDLLQANMTFGFKAFKRWYYSVNAQFKTQMVNSYKSNTNTLRSAFLSPGELNVGVGMTYGFANHKKTFTFDASLSPLSYNMRTVINHEVDETVYDIEKGKTTKNKFGSSVECKMRWQIAYNISLQSRLFSFTNYERIEGDWENTLMFEVNRYLTTQLYIHARYDSETPVGTDANGRPLNDGWKKLQLKEILSLGLSYRFATK